MVQVKVRLCSAPSKCSNFNTVNWYAEKKVHDFFDWSSGCICIENHVSFFLLIDVIHTPKNAQVFALHKCLSPLFIWTRFFQSSSLKYQVWWTGFSVYFKLELSRLQQTEKFISKMEKNSSSSNLIFQPGKLQKSSADR